LTSTQNHAVGPPYCGHWWATATAALESFAYGLDSCSADARFQPTAVLTAHAQSLCQSSVKKKIMKLPTAVAKRARLAQHLLV
jgi:hypothetical protein